MGGGFFMRQKNFFAVSGLLFLGALIFAQSGVVGAVSVSPLSMPSVSAPTMPTVTAPSIGNDYYVPGSSSFYPGIRNGLANRMRQTVPADSQNTSAVAMKNQQNAANVLSVGNKARTSFAGLTASDLNTLNSKGLLDQYSGLLGGNAALTLSNAQASANGSAKNSILLQQILGQLTELKAQNGTIAKPPVSSASFTQEGKRGSKILRFMVNGQDVLSTCRDIYFSTQEADGSFLLTGDRKYVSDGGSHSETFYLLFRANGSTEGITRYTVTPEVTQDTVNEHSFLYQLAQKKNLTAQRTGNLLSMRETDSDWKMDMLLSMQ